MKAERPGARLGKPHRTRPLKSKTIHQQLAAFGERLKDLRYRRGLTQAALAKRAGISSYHYQNIEMAHTDPTLSVVLRLADALDAPLDELLMDYMHYVIPTS